MPLSSRPITLRAPSPLVQKRKKMGGKKKNNHQKPKRGQEPDQVCFKLEKSPEFAKGGSKKDPTEQNKNTPRKKKRRNPWNQKSKKQHVLLSRGQKVGLGKGRWALAEKRRGKDEKGLKKYSLKSQERTGSSSPQKHVCDTA